MKSRFVYIDYQNINIQVLPGNLNFLVGEWVGKSQQWRTTANTNACQKSHDLCRSQWCV